MRLCFTPDNSGWVKALKYIEPRGSRCWQTNSCIEIGKNRARGQGSRHADAVHKQTNLL